MRHGISERSWLAWLDGTLDAGEQSALENHLRECADCRQLSRELRQWQALLQVETQRLRAALRGSDADLERMASRSLERIREAALRRGSGRRTVPEAVAVLRLLMEPICGPGMVRAVVARAVERSKATGRALTWRDWGQFVGHLSDTAASVCGSAVGRLVAQAGSCLAEEGAG